METIQFINQQGYCMPFPKEILEHFEYSSNEEMPASVLAVVRSFPEANEQQLLAAAAFYLDPFDDLWFARKNQLVLIVDRDGLVHWRLESAHHPVPYHYVYTAACGSEQDGVWSMLEGDDLKPGDIQVPTLEMAHAIATNCERRLRERVDKGDKATASVDWPKLQVNPILPP